MAVETDPHGSTAEERLRDPRDNEEVVRAVRKRLVGVSRWAARAREAVAAHALHDNAILIRGETGAGKEFLARSIHEAGDRRAGPFVAISSHSISRESFEAALFGEVRKLPSGRHRVQHGLVERARGGTVYINGVLRFASSLRTRLARLAQFQEYRLQGESLLEAADVRVIFGGRELAEARSTGRLDGAAVGASDELTVPPLRERRVDIAPFSLYFLRRACETLSKEQRRFSPEALALLRLYDWPGNVGELKRVIERVVRQSRPPGIGPSLLPLRIQDRAGLSGYPLPSARINLQDEVKRFERSLLIEALKQSHGVQAKAAEILKVSLTTLHSKIARYGIDVNEFK